MPRNIALIAINNSLNNNSEHNQSNSFVDKCFKLLDKYKYYLTDVCLNCECNQNFANNLILKLNVLEKEYKKLIKEKNVNDLDNNSNNNEKTQCNEDNDRNENENNFLIDFETEKQDNDCDQKSIDELDSYSDNNIERFNTETNSTVNEVTDQKFCDELDSDFETEKENKVCGQKSSDELDSYSDNIDRSYSEMSSPSNELTSINTTKIVNKQFSSSNIGYNWFIGHNLVYQTNQLLFICHIMDTETVIEQKYNTAALISKKKESYNEVVGYGCRWYQCYFFGRFLRDIYQHLKLVHKEMNPYICLFCSNAYETEANLTQHHERAHSLKIPAYPQPDKISSEIPHTVHITTNNDTTANVCNTIEPKPLSYSTIVQLNCNEVNQINDITTKTINKTPDFDIKISSKERKDCGTFFNSHLIGSEPLEVPMADNCFVSVLYSRISNSVNKVVGYRCKWPNNCEFINRCKATVYEHVNTNHTGKRTLKCKHCDNRFTSKAERKMHVKSNHTGNRSFKCNYCDILIASKSERKSHHNEHKALFNSQTDFKHKKMFAMYDGSDGTDFTHRNKFEKFGISIDETSDDIDKSSTSSKNTNTSANDQKSLCQQNQVCNNHIIGIDTEEWSVPDHIKEKSNIYNANLMKAHYSLKSEKKQLIGYKCDWPVCQFFDANVTVVQSHINVTHTGKATFKCRYCSLHFCDSKEGKEHMKSHK